jgi:hypothetical protein
VANLRNVATVLLSLALLAACNHSSTAPQTAAQTVPAWPGKMRLSVALLEIAKPGATNNSAGIPINRDLTFGVQLADAEDRPVTGAKANVSLVMPQMDMGKNEFSLREGRPGFYTGVGRFTMAGPWNVVVTVAADGKTGQKTFPLVVKREPPPQ